MNWEKIKNSTIISIDIETYDPDLLELGPSLYRKEGYILGVGYCTDTGEKDYLNIGHYDVTLDERNKNIEILQKILSLPCPKLFANAMYDCDWLENWRGSEIEGVRDYLLKWEGIEVKGLWYDVQVAEPLIDENQKHNNLDFLGNKYLGIGKAKSKPEIFCQQNNLKGDFRMWLYKMPYYLVYDYVMGDVEIPIQVFNIQKDILKDQELWDLFNLESKLTKCLLLMRKTGVRIDTNLRDRNALKVTNRIGEIDEILFSEFGEFNYKSTKQLAVLFEHLNLPIKYTEKGNPSIKKKDLERLAPENKYVEMILEARQSKDCLSKFLTGSLVKFVSKDGLIHPSIYQTVKEVQGGLNGTRSGRLSVARPNTQQMSAVDKKKMEQGLIDLGYLVRSPFIPFEDCLFGKIDWSQIEYRFMAHFASGPGSSQVRDAYNNDPNTDYHQYIMDITGLKRKHAKILNFGIAYGMGVNKLSNEFQWDLDYAYALRNTYNKKAPYIKHTMSDVERLSLKRGYIKTFLKRRSRLVDRDKAYTMFCRLIQGSAADLNKKAMLDCYEQGLFDVLYLHLNVHDEIDVSIPRTKEGAEAYNEMHHTMENCVKLKVPIKADMEIGPNWADVEEIKGDNKLPEIKKYLGV